MGSGRLTPPAAPPPDSRILRQLAQVDLASLAASFGQALREAGIPITTIREARFAQAISLVQPLGLTQLSLIGRATLVYEVGQLATFDRIFGQVFRGWTDVADSRGDSANQPAPAVRPRRPDQASGGGSSSRGDQSSTPGAQEGPEQEVGLSSSDERLRSKDFSSCTEEELLALRSLILRLRPVAPLRVSRRRQTHPAGESLDLRATLRRSQRTGGDPVVWVSQRRKQRPRRLILIADVSGSMESYTRVYLHLLHGAVRAARAEGFVFATSLTRLTRALAISDPDLALGQAAAAASDWSGGTRIGSAIAEFNDGYGRRGMARGAVVVIVSDGWEAEDPEQLGEQMARLHRLAHKIVWVNPRSASDRYQPLTRGMSAVMPHVDRLVSGHSLAALDLLLAAISDGR